MKKYVTGSTATTVTAISLVTRLWLNEGFNLSNPWIFWSAQVLFIVYYFIRMIQTFVHWKPVGKLTKTYWICSILVECIIYALAFIPGKYWSLFIFLGGIGLAYMIRYQAGLLKKKSYT